MKSQYFHGRIFNGSFQLQKSQITFNPQTHRKVLGQKKINIQNLKLDIDKKELNICKKTKLSSRPKSDFSP